MEITYIKENLPIGTVLAHFNLKPDKNNRLNCPFHKDKTPSMQVYPETNTAYCFSSNCPTHGKAMDTIEIVQRMEKADKHKALIKCEELIRNTTQTIHPINSTTSIKPTMSKEEFLQKMFTYFKSGLNSSKPAQEYLKSRNLDHTKSEIGYNSGQFHHGTRKDETLINKSLQYGLLANSGKSNTGEPGYSAFGKGCIVFALKNKQHEIKGLYFRSTVNNDNSKHFYLKDRAGIYPGHPKQNTKKIILTESIIDAASLQLIIDNGKLIMPNTSIIACYGTNGLNEEIKAAIKELKALEEIIFAFDNDEAGNKAVEKYSNELKMDNGQLIISKIELPCKDVNETLQAHEPEIFTHLLETRTFIFSPDSYRDEKEKIQQPETIVKSDITEKKEIINYPLSTLNYSNPYKLIFTTETAIYCIKGGVDKVMNKLTITLEITNEKLNENINKRRFKLDLYDNKQVEKTIQEASEQLKIDNGQLKMDIEKLTESLDQYREKQLAESQANKETEIVKHILTAQEKSEAMQLATDKNLMDKFKELLTLVGIVGEDENKVFAMTVAISSQFFNPLNCLIQGSSGSGKTNLMKLVCSCMPDGIVKMYTRVSDKMLYHVGANYFVRKVVCFHDVDSLSEEVALIVRELISNGDINTGITYKDDKGNIATKELIVNGPLSTFACTTKGFMYLDNMTRVLIIVMDESEVQTERIIERYLQKSNNKLSKTDEETSKKIMQNFIQILKPYEVYNPYSGSLKLPPKLRDRRRLQMLYIHYVDTITNIFQYQRNKTSDGKLIAVKDDCLLAFRLMFDCILIKLDELDGSLRQFYERLKEWVKVKSNGQLKGFGFTQREIRQELNINNQSLKRYMTDLLDLEYISIKSGGISGSTNKYEIHYWDDYGKMKESLKEEMIKQIDDLEEKR